MNTPPLVSTLPVHRYSFAYARFLVNGCGKKEVRLWTLSKTIRRWAPAKRVIRSSVPNNFDDVGVRMIGFDYC
jgi:hypothetical protein